jgi:hypothetical protein
MLTPTWARGGGENDEHSGFSEHHLKGSWGFTTSWTEDGTQNAVVGITVFDGDGGCTLTFTGNFGGFLVEGDTADECTYEVNEDGTGTITFTLVEEEEEEVVTLGFVIVNRSDTLYFIELGDVVSTGEAQRQ